MFMQPKTQTATINPVFAGHAARQIQDAVGGIHRILDNLLEIANGKDPDANTYDRLRATKVLYDRGFGKVTKTLPRTTAPESERDPKSAKSQNQTNHSSDRPVAKLEEKLDDELGPPRAPVRLYEPGRAPAVPDSTPDLAREAQYYVLEITNYGADLASILAYIHEPDPEDASVRPCHRITAGQMMLDRVLGLVADLEQPLDDWQDPSLESNWAYKHPAEIDPTIPIEKIIEADRFARRHVEGALKERAEFKAEFGNEQDNDPCYKCNDLYLCDHHGMAEELTKPEEELLSTARGMANMDLFGERIYFDDGGRLRLHPPPHIDDS